MKEKLTHTILEHDPVTRTSVNLGPIFSREEIPSYVSVRIAGEDKTFLGIYVGDTYLWGQKPRVSQVQYPGMDAPEVSVHITTNPRIYIPELHRIVHGFQCWWGVIESPDELRAITDEDISGQWYIQALKALSEK